MSTPIDALVRELELEFRADAQGHRAARLLASYARVETDWQRLVCYDPATYTRNLVARTEQFEMLVLCWSAGQQSPIHDHAGQHCFMGILEGAIEEIQYAFPGANEAGPLSRIGARTFERGEVAYIHDRIALHRVRPASGNSAVSLHLYSRPIDVCRVYDERTGEVLSRQLIYHSART